MSLLTVNANQPLNWRWRPNQGLVFRFLALPNETGKTFYDLTRNEKATWVGTQKWRSTQWGLVPEFDGTGNDYLTLENTHTYNDPGVGDICSFAAWIYADSYDATTNTFAGNVGDANNFIAVRNTNILRLQDTTNLDSDITGYTFTLGEWHRVVVVNDGTNNLLYVNGIYRGSDAELNNVEINAFGHGYSSTSYDWNGAVTDFCGWDRILTPAEIWADYDDAMKGYPEALNRTSRWVPGKAPAPTFGGVSHIIGGGICV